jgi:protein involved in polysaccharide export with SLBB domain
VKNGDIVSVRAISDRFDNSVILRGNVANPGRYPWRENMRVKDLLPDYESLVTREHWRQKVAVNRAAIQGATPGGAAIKTEVVHISAEINWNYAVVERMSSEQLTTHLLPFNLRKALTEEGATDNLLLEPGDVVTIFSQDDLRTPMAERSKFVYLEGEFKAAGVYRAEPGETLRQLVERVGGFTPDAYLFGAAFDRVSAQQDQQKQLASVIQSFEGDIERNAQVRLSTANPNDPSVAEFQASLQNQRRIVEQLKQIVPDGRVVLRIGRTADSPTALPDLPLEDGDHFIVPPRAAYVNVLGAVNATTSVLFAPNLRTSDYLRLAGGPTRFADTSHTYVIRANGAVISQHGWGGTVGGSLQNARLMPGDTIVVPENLDKGAFMRGLKDWSQVLGQIGLAAAAIHVLSQ